MSKLTFYNKPLPPEQAPMGLIEFKEKAEMKQFLNKSSGQRFSND